MQAELMKLIAYGKVMEDDAKTLKDYSIKEGDFLVVMISKVSFLFIHSLSGKTIAKAKRRSKNGGACLIAIIRITCSFAESTSPNSIIDKIAIIAWITAIIASWGSSNS